MKKCLTSFEKGFLFTFVLSFPIFLNGVVRTSFAGILLGIFLLASSLVAGLLGGLIGNVLESLWKKKNFFTVKGSFAGAVLFSLLAIASGWIELVSGSLANIPYFPGYLISSFTLEPILKLIKSQPMLIERREPLLVFTIVLLSWLGWVTIGALLGFIIDKLKSIS
jgi:hypothetical protein